MTGHEHRPCTLDEKKEFPRHPFFCWIRMSSEYTINGGHQTVSSIVWILYLYNERRQNIYFHTGRHKTKFEFLRSFFFSGCVLYFSVCFCRLFLTLEMTNKLPLCLFNFRYIKYSLHQSSYVEYYYVKRMQLVSMKMQLEINSVVIHLNCDCKGSMSSDVH